MTDERLFGGTMINPFSGKTHRPGLRRPWRRLAVGLAALGLLLALLSPAWATDGALDPSFNNLGAGVQKIPLIRGQADWTTITNPGPPPVATANGNSLICGYFTSVTDSVKTYTRSSIAKLDRRQRHGGPQLRHPGYWRGARRRIWPSPNKPICDIIIWGVVQPPFQRPNLL